MAFSLLRSGIHVMYLAVESIVYTWQCTDYRVHGSCCARAIPHTGLTDRLAKGVRAPCLTPTPCLTGGSHSGLKQAP